MLLERDFVPSAAGVSGTTAMQLTHVFQVIGLNEEIPQFFTKLNAPLEEILCFFPMKFKKYAIYMLKRSSYTNKELN